MPERPRTTHAAVDHAIEALGGAGDLSPAGVVAGKEAPVAPA
jgi:hypothetical protein